MKLPTGNPESLLPLSPAAFDILLALVDGERHGYGIMQEIARRSEGRVNVGPGTLYRSIRRLLTDGLIEEFRVIDPFIDRIDEIAEYKELVAMGIKTIIDLREDPENYARRSAEQAGLQYINIRLNAKRPPTEAESGQFLSAVNEQANWPVFVHCAGGKHRTGVLIAVYRMEMDGWSARRAYEEMKDYKFYSSSGHGDMKEYVFDYYNRMMAKRAAEPGHMSRPRTVIGSGPEK